MPVSSKRWWWRCFWLLSLGVLALGVKFVLHLVLPRNFAGSGERLPLSLGTGPFDVPYFCGAKKPAGIVILASGDGGWSYWEEKTAKHLVDKGYAVGGWDCRKFADSRTFDFAGLCAGYAAAVDAVRKRSAVDAGAPIWYAGWSTGAEQAVAAATAPDRPRQLVGLLLAAPGTRGRFGITTSDLLGEMPTGPNTFAMAEMAPKLTGLRVVQFAAGLDPLDDVDWIKNMAAPYRLVELPGKLHDMGEAGADFQAELDKAIEWTLRKNP